MPAATSDSFTGPVTGTGSRLDLWQYLPLRWKDICDVDYDVDVDVSGTLLCYVTSKDQVIWRLEDLRQALNESVVTAQALQVYRLFGLVVKTSASRAEDPGFESRLRRDFSGVESYQ